MAKKEYYIPSNWNLICDRSGFKIKASDSRREWNGLRVRKESYEPRHPQDLIHGVPDRMQVPYSRKAADAEEVTTTIADEVPPTFGGSL